MILHPPYIIGARLAPAVRLSDGSYLSLEPSGDHDAYGRPQWRYYVDAPDGATLATGDDLAGPTGHVEAFRALADFLGAWVEAQRYPSSENCDLFPPALLEWADNNHEELYCLVAEPDDHGPGCDGPYNCTCEPVVEEHGPDCCITYDTCPHAS